jgi:hypothetical protein
MIPVYPKDNGSLERARVAFRKKVANWRWEEPEEKQSKPRGRKPQVQTRIETKPRTKSEAMVFNSKFIKY